MRHLLRQFCSFGCQVIFHSNLRRTDISIDERPLIGVYRFARSAGLLTYFGYWRCRRHVCSVPAVGQRTQRAAPRYEDPTSPSSSSCDGSAMQRTTMIMTTAYVGTHVCVCVCVSVLRVAWHDACPRLRPSQSVIDGPQSSSTWVADVPNSPRARWNRTAASWGTRQ